MSVVHLHEVSEDKYIVEMKGKGEDLMKAFDAFIENGVRLYHPKNTEHRFTDMMLDYPEDDLELVNLTDRRRQISSYRSRVINMVYITRSIDDAVVIKMSI